jgi:serine/threonine protein kinase/tetratricopeptide (TPR) repeat protein
VSTSESTPERTTATGVDHGTRAGATLARPSPSDAATLRPGIDAPPSDPSFDRGRVLGRFVLLERIGRGGMGVVVLAYDPELERRVALKLVHPEIAGDEASAARLLREAQALAKLAHPNVVAIHEVGRVDDGIYVAMEYIDGDVLGAWLRARPRPLHEILAVFVAAGQGIAAAHDVGLVHRDIKPDNVMIGRDGRVRVLDFGLARAAATGLRAQRSETSVDGRPDTDLRGIDISLTASGEIMGTPVYMAPEQYAGREVDARTDVYALCVALWEAIDGTRPFAGASLPELAANVGAGRMRSAAPANAPTWLRDVLLRGMAVDPAQRYPDMRALLADLTRDRQRRLRQVGLGLAFVGAIGLGAATIRPASPCTDDDVLAGTWDPERRGAVEAAFAASTKPWADDSRELTLRTLDGYAGAVVDARREACLATRVHGTQSDALLERRMACLDRRVHYLGGLTDALAAGQPDAIEHAVDAAVGLPRVEGCADTERLLREPSLPADATARVEIDALRRELDQLDARMGAGAYDELDDRIAALEARARTSEYEPALAEALLLRGRWERRRGLPEPASAHLVDALAHATRSGYDAIAVRASSTLVLVEGGLRDRFDVADIYAAQGLAVLHRLGDEPELHIDLLTSIGQLETTRGRHDRAIEALSEAMALARTTGVDAEPSTYLLHAMGRALTAARRFDEAEHVLATMTAAVLSRLGSEHPDFALAMGATAALRTAQDRPEEALVALARARSILIAAHGPDHIEVAVAENSVGRALSELRRDAEAAEAYAHALGIIERALGSEHHNVATGLANLAAVQTRMGRADLAVPGLRRALEIRIARFGVEHDMVGKTLDLLGEALLAEGDAAGAREAFERAIAVFEALGGREDRRLRRALEGLASIATQAGDDAGARAYRTRAAALPR